MREEEREQEIERRREEAEEELERLEPDDGGEPWAKFSTGRDPDE